METSACILSRRSIRRFKPDTVSVDTIEEIISHTRFSPSWANTKTARYHCVSTPQIKTALSACCYGYNKQIVQSAPHVLVLTAVTGRCGIGSRVHTPNEWLMFDSGLAAQTFCLAAHDRGIGTIILGAFDKAPVEQLIALPEEEELIALIPFGYPDETPVPPRRKEVADILHIL